MSIHELASRDLVLLRELRQRCIEFEFKVKPRLDDDFLQRILHVRNYNVGKAFKSLQVSYSCLYDNLDFIQGVEASQTTVALGTGTVSFLKNRSEGLRVAIVRPQMWDPANVAVKNMQLSILYQGEYISRETLTQDAGVVIVFDLAQVRLAHLRSMSLKEIKRTARVLQVPHNFNIFNAIVSLQKHIQTFPIKVKGIHVVNPHYLARPLIAICLRLATRKFKERLLFHMDLQDLHKVIDPEILPTSYEGKLKDSDAYDSELTKRILKDNIKYEDFWNGNFRNPFAEK